jgi:hypothetical protein
MGGMGRTQQLVCGAREQKLREKGKVGALQKREVFIFIIIFLFG